MKPEKRMNYTGCFSSIMNVKNCFGILLLVAGVAGCTTSTIETRRHERWLAYGALSAEQRELVDQGQVRIGMPMDAVYIAWGNPAEVLEREEVGSMKTIWRFHGAYAKETRYWSYREVSHDGRTYLERYLDRDFDPRNYVRAEITFEKGRVSAWQTKPRPLD
jgi:hypothetical protein